MTHAEIGVLWFESGHLFPGTIHGNYNQNLVMFSVMIAILSSYIAIDMCLHLRKRSSELFRFTWLIGSAIVMGIGLWTMDLLGLLALKLHVNVPITFNLYLITLSFVVAALTAGITFYLFTINKLAWKDYLMSGIILGIGIAIMHNITLNSMNNIITYYSPIAFILSVLIAILGTTASNWFAIQSDVMRQQNEFIKRGTYKAVSSVALGIGITGMHYTGIAGTFFSPGVHVQMGSALTFQDIYILIGVTTGTVLLLAILLSTARYFITLSQQQKEFLSAILNNMGEGLIICNESGRITTMNRAIEAFQSSDVLLSMRLSEWTQKIPLCDPNTKVGLTDSENPFYKALQEENIRGVQVLAKDKYGENRNMLIYSQLLHGQEGEKLGSVIVLRDITDSVGFEATLLHQATHDPLTSLPNRALLLDRIKQAIALGVRQKFKVVLIFIDLDNFKYVNDSLGHKIGDGLLKVIAERISGMLRQSDTLARIGGDELVIVLPHQKDIVYVHVLLEQILKEIAKPVTVEDHILQITGSLGISIFPEDGTNADVLLKNADTAMYEAKKKGRNNFEFFTREMDTQVRNRLELERGLRSAIENNELFLMYQPKLNLKENKITGFEALLRWQHPERGLVYPGDFIYIAEDTGLIITIGDWVIETACKQCLAWQEQGLPAYPISVNLSIRQCKSAHLVERIADILTRTGINPALLELEVTESMAIESPGDFLKVLGDLKKLGVKLSMDDFGSGYSSLNYLRRFPIDYLKIDQSFIRELHSKNESTIVQAIIALGHALNLEIVAEGVETSEQLSQLKRDDCDNIQGYYCSRPLLAEKVPDFLNGELGRVAGTGTS